ncbi:MAG: glycosyltransferase family 39 protein [Thermomicrobia bacterium]|nr:glycosyltransferase family 39 protein [Thermomicrobia bacterium]
MATVEHRRATSAVSPPHARAGWQRWHGGLVPLVLLAALMLLGGLMRRYHLGQQGLWFDEADLVMRARQSLPVLLRNVINPGENGPLYTLGLAAWIKALGTSEVAVRLPSAIAGTLAIPALYGLGRTLRGPRLGLIAAALLTISPYAHWYAQDAKMYSLLILLTIVATWLLLVAIRRGGAAWIGYGIIAALTLGIHATFLLMLAAHALIAVGLWRVGYGVRPAGRQARWLALLIGVAALPLLIWGVIFTVRNSPTWQVKATPWALLQRMLVEFSVTNRADTGIQTWGTWLYLVLIALGIGLTWWAGNGKGGALLPRPALLIVGAMTAIPILLFMLLSLQRAVFEPRYLTVALPGFLLLAALALDGLLRRRPLWLLAIAGGVAVVIVAWLPLRDVNFSTVPQKEDWRAAYRHLAEHARAGDGVVIYPGYLRSTYDYYALQFPALRDLPVVMPPALGPGTDVTDRALDAYFTKNTQGWERAWLVESPERAPSQDPAGRILGFYTDGIPVVNPRGQTLFEERKYNGVLLDCFVYDGPYRADRLPPQAVPDLQIGDTGIGLLGVSLYDIPPLDGHWPTSTWRPKDDPYDPHDLFIPPDLAPGQYHILIGMAPTSDLTHPLPIMNRDGTRVDTNGLVAVLPIAVT